MQFPSRGIDIIDALFGQHRDLAQGSDDQRRTLTQLIGEQMSFELGQRWGNKKRAGVGDNFRSKDAIAYSEDDGTCSVWDWQSGSTRERAITAGSAPSYPHLSTGEATFMLCAPINHLSVATQPPVTPVDPGIPVPTLGFLATRIDDVEDATGRIEGLLADLKKQSDDNTEKIQQQIDQAIKNAEASVKNALPQILAALGGSGGGVGAIIGGLFNRGK